MSIENPGAAPSDAPSPEESAQEVLNAVDAANAESGEESQESVEEVSDQELQDVIEDDDASEEDVQEAKAELAKRISMKINGKEQEFDLSNDDHIEKLREMAQKGEGADQKFQEAANMRKQLESFVQLMQDNPFEALKKLGHDPDSLTESYLQKRVEELQKSPEQLEREKLQKELEDIKAEKERLQQERLEAEKSAAQEKYSRQLDQEITDALSKSEMPKSPYVVKRLAEYMMLGLQKNPEFQVSDAIPLVERQIKKEIREMFGAMPEDVVEKVLGTDVTNKLRKRRLQKMKKAPESATSVRSTGKAEMKASEPKKEPQKMSAKDFFSDFGDL